MTFDRDFLDLMDRQVTVNAFAGYSTDGYSAKTYSTTSYTVKCYIVKSHKLVKDQNGKEVLSTTQVYTPPYDNSTSQTTVAIGISDKITLPSSYGHTSGNLNPPIISIEWFDDDTGRYCQVLNL